MFAQKESLLTRLSTLIIFFITLTACGGENGSNPNNVVFPEITSFVSDKDTIVVGENAILTAVFPEGTGAIDNSVGDVVSGEQYIVTPGTTTTYTLTVTDADGMENTATVIVEVTEPVFPTLSDRMLDIENIIEQTDGVNPWPGSLSLFDGVVQHNFDTLGFSYCIPNSPYVAPNPALVQGKTTVYGCDNNITLTYEVISPVTIQVFVNAENVYIDTSGNVVKSGATYNYAGYVTASGYVASYYIDIIDNGDGTYSLGELTFANVYTLGSSPVNLMYNSAQTVTNNASITTSDVFSGIFLSVQLAAGVSWQELNTAIPALGSFVF